LVTGATGRVGWHLVKILSLYDKEFYLSHRMMDSSNPSLRQKIKAFKDQGLINLIELDYGNPESITHHKLEGIDKIFLVSPYFNVLETTKKFMVEAQKTKSVQHIVKLSAMGIDLSPTTYGGLIHKQAEEIIKESGFHYTFLRPNFFMQNFIKQQYHYSTNGKTFCLPLNNARASFVDIRDVSEVAATILHEKSNKHYNMAYDVTGGERFNCSEIAEILQTILGQSIMYTNVSEQRARTNLLTTGLQIECVNYLIDFYRIIREGRMRRISNVVQTILGRKPISFEAFARDHLELLKNRVELKSIDNNN